MSTTNETATSQQAAPAAVVDEFYELAAQAVAENPADEPTVARVLGLAGYDYPRGSGDYHGGKPAAEMTAEDCANSQEEVFVMMVGRALGADLTQVS